MKTAISFTVSFCMVLAVSPTATSAQSSVTPLQFGYEKRIKTVGGTLAFRVSNSSVFDVLLKDKVVASIDSEGVTGPSFLAKFSRKGGDVVLFSSNMGTSCIATYYLLAVSPEGTTAFSGNDGIGNCNEITALTYDDNKVSVSIPAEAQGRPSKLTQSEVWVWDYSDKPPVKHK